MSSRHEVFQKMQTNETKTIHKFSWSNLGFMLIIASLMIIISYTYYPRNSHPTQESSLMSVVKPSIATRSIQTPGMRAASTVIKSLGERVPV